MIKKIRKRTRDPQMVNWGTGPDMVYMPSYDFPITAFATSRLFTSRLEQDMNLGVGAVVRGKVDD